MKEKLIEFITAKLAKEKGFDIKHKEWFNKYGIVCPQKGIGAAVCIDDSNCGYRCTQSLLKKWLREKHNIHISTDCYVKSNKQVQWEITLWQINPKQNIFEHTGYDTHEEALEIGLQIALQQIDN